MAAYEQDATSGRIPRPPWAVRLVFVILGLAAWFLTQSWIASRPAVRGTIGDAVLDLLQSANQILQTNRSLSDALLIVSSLIIDVLGVFLLVCSIWGPTLRPFIGLLMLFSLRQICQGLCALPPPDGMLWYDPGFPSLLVTYGVSNDLFFSGHTALAVLGIVELARLVRRRWLTILALVVACFEILAVLMLRAHYTMDVYAGAVTALLVAGIADRIAPHVDAWLGRQFGRQVRD